MLDLGNKLSRRAVRQNLQFSGVDRDLQVAGSKSAGENHLAGILRDVDEAAGTGQAWAELRDIEVTLAVGLGQPEESDVEAAPW